MKHIYWFLTNPQRKIVERCLKHHTHESSLWSISNVLFPIAVILIPLCFWKFAPTNKQDLREILLNGGIPLIGVNILFAMAGNLVNIPTIEPAQTKKDLHQLKQRLQLILLFLYLFGIILYTYQLLGELKGVWEITIISLLTIFLLLLSINYGKFIYIIKDDLIGEVYDVKEEMNEKKEEMLKTNKKDDEYEF